MNSNLISIMSKTQKQNETTNSDGSFAFSLTDYTQDLFSYIKIDLLNLDISQEDKDKITAYFSENI